MSWNPFVSRARFEDERRKVEELEVERRRLLDRIALMSGQPPLYSERPATTSTPVLVQPAKKAEGEPQRGGRISRKDLLQRGNEAAAQRARVPGSQGVVAEMRQHEELGRQRAAEMLRTNTEPAVEHAG